MSFFKSSNNFGVGGGGGSPQGKVIFYGSGIPTGTTSQQVQPSTGNLFSLLNKFESVKYDGNYIQLLTGEYLFRGIYIIQVDYGLCLRVNSGSMNPVLACANVDGSYITPLRFDNASVPTSISSSNQFFYPSTNALSIPTFQNSRLVFTKSAGGTLVTLNITDETSSFYNKNWIVIRLLEVCQFTGAI
jgi:hypothetical protein